MRTITVTLLIAVAVGGAALWFGLPGRMSNQHSAGDINISGNATTAVPTGIANLSPDDIAASYRDALLHLIDSESERVQTTGRFTAFFGAPGGLAAAVQRLERVSATDPLELDAARDEIAIGVIDGAVQLLAGHRDALMAAGPGQRSAAAKSAAAIGALKFYSDMPGALAAYKQAVELDPADPMNLVWLGHITRWDRQYPLAIELYQQALIGADRDGNEALIAHLAESLGQTHRLLGDLPLALDYFKQAEARLQSLSPGGALADLYMAIGETLIAADQGAERLPESLQYFSQAVDLNQDLGRHRALARSYNQLAQVRQMTGDIDTAIVELNAALEIAAERNLHGFAADRAADLGALYWDDGDLPKAADYFQRALIHNQNANRQAQVAAAHANLGLVFEELGDVDQMCAHWRQAQLLYLDSGDGDQAAFYGVLLEQAACALR